jgi:hypothetical protein
MPITLPRRPLALLPFLLLVPLVLFAVYFGWSRDFGAFVIGYLLFPPAALGVAIILLAWAVFDRTNRPACLTALATGLVVVPAGVFLELHFHDRISFWLWRPAHQAVIERYASKDQIITGWDSWGMAGMSNDSYLVSNPNDSISSLNAATKWVHRIQPACDAAAVERMARGLYIITTYNCPL